METKLVAGRLAAAALLGGLMAGPQALAASIAKKPFGTTADGTAVEVAPTPEPPPPDPNPDPTVPPPPPEESRVPTWLYNDTYPATFVGMSTPTGRDGNIASNPAFLAPATGDFHLGADSACADKGDPGITDADGTRADMGAYGGPTPMP